MTDQFDHDKLNVYQEAVDFVSWATKLLNSISGKAAAKDQLDRASTSIVLNIAEGNGKFSVKDRCRFLSIAYGSAVESVACLDVFVAKGLATPEEIEEGRRKLKSIVAMLVGLKNSLMDRVREEPAEYVPSIEE